MGYDLTRIFEKSSQEIKGKELDALRQNYYIEASMRGSDETSIAGINVNTSGRHDNQLATNKKKKQSTQDILDYIAMLDNQLAIIENKMIDKYGEDFAENLAAEYLDKETYQKLIEIEDQEERRHAIAKAINDGIENGTIDADKITNPDFKEWLDIHKDKYQQLMINAKSNITTDNLTIDSKEADALNKFNFS